MNEQQCIYDIFREVEHNLGCRIRKKREEAYEDCERRRDSCGWGWFFCGIFKWFCTTKYRIVYGACEVWNKVVRKTCSWVTTTGCLVYAIPSCESLAEAVNLGTCYISTAFTAYTKSCNGLLTPAESCRLDFIS